VSRGGNLLLDIGPAADGRIPVIMEERLLQLGEFLKASGEAIYGTRRWRTTSEGETIRYTARGDTVYAIVLGWPGGAVTLKAPRTSGATKVRLLGTSGPVRLSTTGAGLRIEMPEGAPVGAYAHAFELTGAK
jgi:alpha-L-fucosidase